MRQQRRRPLPPLLPEVLGRCCVLAMSRVEGCRELVGEVARVVRGSASSRWCRRRRLLMTTWLFAAGQQGMPGVAGRGFKCSSVRLRCAREERSWS